MTATSIASALRAAREVQPDLAVVDLRLGRESGLDLLAALKALEPRPVAVLVSGYLSVAHAAAALEAGAAAVAFKPMTLPEVIRQVEDGVKADKYPGWDETPSLARAEWEHINRVLVDCGGNITAAARRLGIFRQSLQRKLRKRAPHT